MDGPATVALGSPKRRDVPASERPGEQNMEDAQEVAAPQASNASCSTAIS